MTTRELAETVWAMRSAQVEYFRTRSLEVLERARDLERRVDLAVARIRVPGLFAEPEE